MNLKRQMLCIGTLAGASLMLESTLTRLLAVSQYYHFAFLVVSLALLGYGTSGTFLVLFKVLPRLSRFPMQIILRWVGIGFTVSVAIAYGIVNIIPFDSYAIAWDNKQFAFLGLFYVVLSLPFLMSGLATGAAIDFNKEKSHLIYAANLMGSGLGAVVAPGILWLTGVPGAVLFSGLLGLAAVFPLNSDRKLEQLKKKLKFNPLVIPLAVGFVVFITLSTANLQSTAFLGVTLSPYKGLAQAIKHANSEIIFSRWNSISKVDVVEGAGTHLLPGLSYMYQGEIPEQLGISIDAESLQPITLASLEDLPLLSYLPEAVSFTLRPDSRTLVVEPGGGLGVIQAVSGSADEVVVLQENPLERKAVSAVSRGTDVFDRPEVQVVAESSRIFMGGTQEPFDIIFFPLTDAYRPITSGAFSLTEEYDLTVESFKAAIGNLTPGGMLVISRWLQIPPSESIRLAATLMDSMDELSVQSLAERFIMFRGIQTMTILVKPSGWDQTEIQGVRSFCEGKKYDLVWFPGIKESDVNQYNKLQSPLYYEQIKNLFTTVDRSQIIDAYPYSITPATDNHPFFFHFFKWEQTPQVVASFGHIMQPFGGSGFLVLLVLLVIVIIVSAFLIIMPLIITTHLGIKDRRGNRKKLRWRTFGYFSLLGFAFLFVEIPLIQQSILLFGNPTYAFTIIVCVILVFSGLGSSISRWEKVPKRLMIFILAVLTVFIALIFPNLIRISLGWSIFMRIAITIGVISPLALLMGFPFPIGLVKYGESERQIIPWIWAVNGSVSVVASVVAAILILSYGFREVQLIGGLIYGIAAFLFISSSN